MARSRLGVIIASAAVRARVDQAQGAEKNVMVLLLLALMGMMMIIMILIMMVMVVI